LLAQTQPLVLCDPNVFAFPAPSIGAGTLEAVGTTYIPIPPITAFTLAGGGNGTSTTTLLCSAGTADSVTAFMKSKMPAYGWKSTTIDGQPVWSQTLGDGYQELVRISPVIDPKNWSITLY
jgi:hypothetical protein